MVSGVIRAAIVAGLLCASGVAAQERVQPGTGVALRVLDKLTGSVADLTIPTGAQGVFGRITILSQDCRFPEGNPAGDAYALLSIDEVGQTAPIFEGWIVASSPALNPMDHPRYDVWALRCTTS